MTESMSGPEPDLGPLMMSYRDTAHEAFVPPPVASIAGTARRRARRRTAVGAAAALVAVAVAGVVTLSGRAHDGPAPADDPPVPSASATADSSPTPTPSGSPSSSPSSSRPPSSSKSVPGAGPKTGSPSATSSGTIVVTLNPPSVARGGTVLVGGGCWDSYGKQATARSTAFGTLTLNPMGGGPGARVTIGQGIRLGEHTVNVTCGDGQTGSATLTVLASG